MANAAQSTADDEARARDGRDSGAGIVLAGDRTLEFRRARLHSYGVRLLRAGFPLGAVAISGLYIWTMLDKSGYGHPMKATVPPVVEKVVMDNPRYNGFAKDGGTYTVTAVTAIPDLANPSLVQLNHITGEMYDVKKSRTDLTATDGVFDSKANKLDLSNGIKVVTETGLTANLLTATLMTKEGTIVSTTPVEVLMPSGRVTSKRMNLNQKTRDVTFEDTVVTHLVPADKPAATTGAVAATAPAAFGNSKTPVDVNSDRLDVHDGKKTAQFSGRVRAVQGLSQLETAVLDVTYVGGGKDAPLPGTAPAPAAPGDPAVPATKIQRIVAPGPVVLTQGTGDRVTGNTADFDANAEVAVITGNVVITSGVDRRATSERVEFQQKPDTILLTGNVVVNQGRNELRGRRLFVDRKAGKTLLESPADGALPKSRIFARLYQGDPAKPGAAPKAPGAAAAPGADTGSAMTFKTDPNAPVDIEANQLAVDDTKKVAIFTGDVTAAQADFVVHTIELHATYTGEAGLASAGTPAAATPAAPAAAKTPAQLTRIEAKGRVIVTSKSNQKVTGDAALFDMKANTVVVTGGEVIVTQSNPGQPDNIINCTRLVIMMSSGTSDCAADAVVATEAAEGAKVKRQSAVFYPGDRNAAKGGPKPAPAQPASSSWQSSVAPNK